MPHPIVRALTALGLALAACVGSTNPAGPESEALAEKGLIGTWRYAGTLDDVWTYFHVLPLPSNRLQVVAINELRSDWAVLAGHITAAGPRRVINLRVISASDGVRAQIEKEGRSSHPYSFVVYRFEARNRLVIAQPFKPLRAAMQAGKLYGESSGNAAFVADDSQRITEILAAATDPDLFAQTAVYLRVEAP